MSGQGKRIYLSDKTDTRLTKAAAALELKKTQLVAYALTVYLALTPEERARILSQARANAGTDETH